jgi:deazaflavin-dependent oxidoreductase (nitroreductase family)
MGLMQELGYEVPVPNAFQRASWKFSSSRVGAWLLSKSLHHVDRFLLRLTRGRTTVPSLLGVPVITLVTTGARSGLRRELPLIGVPAGDDIAVIGTNYGQRPTPAWYHNLRANPKAEVVYRGRAVAVTGREAVGDERQALWERGRQVYPGYEAYASRISGRDVHIMVLEPLA